ncbi:MAG: hypothetical protein WA240_03935 [Nitrospirota bacterium]
MDKSKHDRENISSKSNIKICSGLGLGIKIRTGAFVLSFGR